MGLHLSSSPSEVLPYCLDSATGRVTGRRTADGSTPTSRGVRNVAAAGTGSSRPVTPGVSDGTLERCSGEARERHAGAGRRRAAGVRGQDRRRPALCLRPCRRSIGGAARATQEYVAGDLEMAADVRHDTIRDPGPGTPSGQDGGTRRGRAEERGGRLPRVGRRGRRPAEGPEGPR
ncbi:DUF6507 family protein [Streptomyces andamanensis]|uniref:DUF6507 family protein n=1 Tax=Streptomyces andamanensis TaxID=1565035 RepID=A0ABV8TBK4_9ACTN